MMVRRSACKVNVKFHGQIEPRSKLSSGMKDPENLVSVISFDFMLADQ